MKTLDVLVKRATEAWLTLDEYIMLLINTSDLYKKLQTETKQALNEANKQIEYLKSVVDTQAIRILATISS
jgi:hypothetical protein